MYFLLPCVAGEVFVQIDLFDRKRSNTPHIDVKYVMVTDHQRRMLRSLGWKMLLRRALGSFFVLMISASLSNNFANGAPNDRPPNFLLILLDDLDVMLKSSDRTYLPRTWNMVADEGTVFENMAVSMAWCCPSRVSLLTGKLVHNSNITSSTAPNGENGTCITAYLRRKA